MVERNKKNKNIDFEMIWFVDIGLVKIKIGQIAVMNIKTSILGKETKGTSILCLIWGLLLDRKMGLVVGPCICPGRVYWAHLLTRGATIHTTKYAILTTTWVSF